MKRINQILEHPVYQQKQKRIDELEENRLFCKHGVDHALDVARILYILVLENQASYQKDVVYAAALLHDLGRCDQYEKGIPHHEASAKIAEPILKDCGYQEEEIIWIVDAIRAHEFRESTDENSLKELLFRADKLSRNCFDCKVEKDCYWPIEQKNQIIWY